MMLINGLARVHANLGRKITILDVGGVETFWEVVGPLDFADITIINLPEALEKPYWFTGRRPEIHREPGSALDLAVWRHRSPDVIISNSVIEHVGRWDDTAVAARELRSVAQHGWVQTPAFSFPIEPHFALPFVHWFAPQIQAVLLRILPHHGAGDLGDIAQARREVEANHILTSGEFAFLFPDSIIIRERFLGLTKSFTATWGLMSPETMSRTRGL
jgi:hypothetical protein